MQSTGAAEPNSMIKGMRSFNDRIHLEREARVQAGKDFLNFGVTYLDEALGGIFKSDLVVIGAGTGLGKSQLGTLIALTNARKGRRIHYLALEAEEFEIERRIKYQEITDAFYKLNYRERPQIKLNYQDWYYGFLDKDLDAIEREVESTLFYPTLNIYYRDTDFGISEFKRIALSMKEETDLFVVDHLHYFDIDDDNENRAVKEIVKSIRDVALITGKPVVLVSHVRKRDRRTKQLVPEIEDFHGSSDIGKIATKAITLAPCFDRNLPDRRETFMTASKNRVDSARSRHVALMAFDLQNHRYEHDYYLGRINGAGDKFEPYGQSALPFWAKSALPGEPGA